MISKRILELALAWCGVYYNYSQFIRDNKATKEEVGQAIDFVQTVGEATRKVTQRPLAQLRNRRLIGKSFAF